MAMSDSDGVDKDTIRLHLDGPKKSSWYHGRLSRSAAEKVLFECDKQCCFLVRESISKPGVYVLSYLGIGKKYSHFRITSICGEYYIGGRQFSSIEDLVAYYTNWSDLLPEERLRNPIAPEKSVDDVRYLKALLPYTIINEDSDEVTFEKNDIFEVCNELANGWLWATNLRTGQSGLIYSDLFVDLHDDVTGEKVEDLDYFHPLVSNNDVKEILTKAGTGSFLLRTSDKTPGDYTLCLFANNTLHRFKITRHGNGFLMGRRFFERVSDIIERYKHDPILEVNSQKLVFAVKANIREPFNHINDSTMQRVLQTMRQSSTGVNLISKKATNYLIDGYLYMKKEKSKKSKRLFFALNSEDEQLYYVENPKRSRPDGIIDLNYTSLYPLHESLLSRSGVQLQSSVISDYQVYYLWSEPAEDIQRWKEYLKHFCKNTKSANKHSSNRHGAREILSLSINIVEAKQVPDRLQSGAVYCQISLNELAVAKTLLKESSTPVWDEEFLISDMPTDVESCKITLCFRSKKSGSKDAECFQLTKKLAELINVEDFDEWCNMAAVPNSSYVIDSSIPHIRLKIKYKHDYLLPLSEYSDIKSVLLFKDCQIVSTLGLLCENPSDRADLAQALLKVFRHDKKEVTLLKTLTSVEIANEENAATLFRSTSLATTLMDQYMKLTAGDFVRSALQKTVLKITEANIKVELDPNALENSSALESNKAMLLQLLNDLLAAIISAKNDCPSMLRHICSCLQRNVAKRWPDNEIVKPRVVSGFIFLRLLCPAIVNPKQFNLVQDTPQESASRTLKLVAKSLINLANLVEVGAKELYMEAIGPFIIDNKSRMITFLNDLADMSEIAETDRSLTSDDLLKELSTIHKICSTHLNSLRQRSATQPALKKLVAAIHALDMTKVSYFGASK